MKREEQIFERALALSPVEAREAYLLGACGDDRGLRQRVDALLAAHREAGDLNFLKGDERAEAIDLTPSADRLTEQTGDRIGRYKLLQQIGEGGCGVVYLAEQQEPVRRKVALKVIKLGMDTKSVMARFEAERQALALMDHPNIARVLDAGATGTGRPYFVMELVRGTKITDYSDQSNLATRDRLDLFIKVCQAIQHAHQKGVIHRDVKPSNILVTLHDGVAVPKVIDFGIAKATTDQRLTDKTLFTALEQFIGTPAYMSPEQAEMSGLDLDTRCDIYSLGVLLYELLTGKTPFDANELLASGLDAMRRTIREKEPVRPSTRLTQELAAAGARRLGLSAGKPATEEESRAASRRLLQLRELIPLLRGDLDWIVMKCLEKDRTRRYDTANGLAVDLKRHLNNEPVVARPPSVGYRAWKFIRRNRLPVTVVAAVALALVAGLGIATYGLVSERRAHSETLQAQAVAVRERRLAEAGGLLARKTAYAAEMQLAYQALEHSHLGHARELLDRQQPTTTSASPGSPGEPPPANLDLRGWEWRFLWARTRGEALLTIRGGTNDITDVLFLEDGRTAASVDAGQSLKFWDLETRQLIAQLPCPEGAYRLAGSPDRSWLVVGGDTGWSVWNPVTRQLIHSETNAHSVAGLDISPDGRLLAVAGGPEIRIVECASWRPLRTFRRRTAGEADHAQTVGLAFSPDGNTFAYGHADDRVVLCDLERGTEVELGRGNYFETLSLAFSPDGRFLAGGDKGGLAVWEIAGRARLRVQDTHRSEVTCVAFSPDGRLLATAGSDQTLKLWDTGSWTERATLTGHEHEIQAVAFSPDSGRLISSGRDRTIRVWEARPQAAHSYQPPVNAWWHMPHPPGDRAVLVEGDWDSIRFFHRPTLTASDPRPAPPGLAAAPVTAFGRDARSVALVREDGVIELWSTEPFDCLQVLSPTAVRPVWLTFAESRPLLAVRHADGSAAIWDLEQHRVVLELPTIAERALPSGYGFGFAVSDCVFTRLIEAEAGGRQGIEIWRLASRKRQVVWPHHEGSLQRIAFSPDGTLLATTAWDGRIKLHEVETGRERATLSGELRVFTCVVFCPDGNRLMAGGFGGYVTIWDVDTHQIVAHWRPYAHWCARLSFHDGDQTLIALGDIFDVNGHWSGTLKQFPVPPLEQIDLRPTGLSAPP